MIPIGLSNRASFAIGSPELSRQKSERYFRLLRAASIRTELEDSESSLTSTFSSAPAKKMDDAIEKPAFQKKRSVRFAPGTTTHDRSTAKKPERRVKRDRSHPPMVVTRMEL